jgi:hypothetical protein
MARQHGKMKNPSDVRDELAVLMDEVGPTMVVHALVNELLDAAVFLEKQNAFMADQASNREDRLALAEESGIAERVSEQLEPLAEFVLTPDMMAFGKMYLALIRDDDEPMSPNLYRPPQTPEERYVLIFERIAEDATAGADELRSGRATDPTPWTESIEERVGELHNGGPGRFQFRERRQHLLGPRRR